MELELYYGMMLEPQRHKLRKTTECFLSTAWNGAPIRQTEEKETYNSTEAVRAHVATEWAVGLFVAISITSAVTIIVLKILKRKKKVGDLAGEQAILGRWLSHEKNDGLCFKSHGRAKLVVSAGNEAYDLNVQRSGKKLKLPPPLDHHKPFKGEVNISDEFRAYEATSLCAATSQYAPDDSPSS